MFLPNRLPNPIGASSYWGDADAADRAAGAVADGFDDDVGAVAAGELTDALDAFVAALFDDVGGAEFAAEVGAGLVAPHQDSLLGAELFGREHGEEADGAVADHRGGAGDAAAEREGLGVPVLAASATHPATGRATRLRRPPPGKGLRREEVALLAGVSIDYYVRMERGNLSGASDRVLDAVARLSGWTRPSTNTCSRWPRRPARPLVPAALRRVASGRPCSRCSTGPRRPAAAAEHHAIRLSGSGRAGPHARALIELVGELSTQSECSCPPSRN